ncbi:MAG TPA: phosphotransacetylase family protein [Anaerolineales bacterium]|nr:phosphotransacetylase family protein [Anaerolineales bacterium]
MKSLFVTSIERYSGKTAVCLALGRRFQADGFRVGYLKPLSLQPLRIGNKIVDEDAVFVKDVLGLKASPWDLSPVVVTPDSLRQYLSQGAPGDPMKVVQAAFNKAADGQDILLLEGGASLREGHAVGLPTPDVALALSSHVLIVVKYRSEVRLLDDTLSGKARLGGTLTGAILNSIPSEATAFIRDMAIPFLEKRGIPIFGWLPRVRSLAALTVGELIDVLRAQVLTEKTDRSAMVENLTVGAMTADAALHRFREQINKAVITGGDRTDIQLAALETSTTCLILTGNLPPSPLIVKQAEAFGVAVLLVRANTMETIEAIDRVFGKSRLGQPAKLAVFQELFNSSLDLERLYAALGLGKG